jgi:protein involved in polysaccharide export with SLBB domain
MKTRLFFLTFVIILAVGCHHKGPPFNPHMPVGTAGGVQTASITNSLPPELLNAPPEPFRLGPGDRLDVELLGDPLTKTSTIVGPDGKMYFYYLPGIDVWGLTLSETKAAIDRELGKFIRNQAEIPPVGITLRAVESRRVWLLGRFQNPGIYAMTAPMRVLEAVAAAGGTMSLSGNQQSNFAYTSEELADLERAFIIRSGKLLPVNFRKLLKDGDLSQNIYLQPDDFVYMPPFAAREVYVLGAVFQPKAVPYNDEVTLVSAIASAGATIQDAYVHHVAIVRGSLSNPQIAIVDYRNVIEGKAENVRLEPQDIVYVPFSPYRYLSKYLNLILDTFVGAVAINEGARAAIKEEAAPTGVFIPLGSRIQVNGPVQRQ